MMKCEVVLFIHTSKYGVFYVAHQCSS